MEYNVINTLLDQERVTSTYADIYFDDNYCHNKLLVNEKNGQFELKTESHENINSEWISPSDLLIGKVELNPPFTSKVTRGKTHEGILAIGNEILQKEYRRFLASLSFTIRENNESWNYILVNEKKTIIKKIKHIYQDVFQYKSKIMNEEIIKFYEQSLQDLEKHLRLEVYNELNSVQAHMISTLNIEILSKLKIEKNKLHSVLKKKYSTELNKIITYYKLLLDNELCKNNKLINSSIRDRNDALQSFCRQIDAERLTTTMYIMSIERKKCKIKRMFMENLQSAEQSDKLMIIKQRQDILDAIKEKERTTTDINKQWEDKMKRILELFLKFISFSLKLLPEQSTFLLDYQQMVVLQLKEMQKQPHLHSSILIEEQNLDNIFKFKSPKTESKVCEFEPFTLEGDLSETVPPSYGSTETLPSTVDLPTIRVNRHYVYAKCHGYEDIKKILKSQICQCRQQPSPTYSQPLPSPPKTSEKSSSVSESPSSTEFLLFDDMLRLEECPNRKCGHWIDRNLFPFLPSYVDFTENNYQRVKAILGRIPSKDKIEKLIIVKNIAGSEIPFEKTKEKYRNAETQYSTQVLEVPKNKCTCSPEYDTIHKNISIEEIDKISSKTLGEVLAQRKISLRRLLDQKPNLLKIFTEESFDFQL